LIVSCIFLFNQVCTAYTIKIGAVQPLSGNLAVYGEGLKMAIDLVVDEVNSNGRINGNKREVTYEDGKTILMVEQNVKQAFKIAHRCYLPDLWKNRFKGEAHALLDDPKVKRLYLGGGDAHEDL